MRRIVAALVRMSDVLHSALLTVFLALVGMVLAAWLGGGLPVIAAGGFFGLLSGLAISKRVWFAKAKPVPLQPMPADWHTPGVQDEFERRLGRQRVLGFLLIAALLLLMLARAAIEWNWPRPFGVPHQRLLAAAWILIAVVLPLGLLNWRCPNCRRNLGRTLSLRQCPRCGVVLRG